jgi:predicted phage replisome organizer
VKRVADVKWIKLSVEMFDDEKIEFIQGIPEGDAILVIWVRLLVLAGKCNANGYIYLTEEIPYTEDSLAFKFRKPTNIIKLALQTFQRLKMIEINEKGILLINWPKYQNMEGLDKIKQREQAKLRKRNQREKQKQIQAQSCSENKKSRDSHSDVTRDPSYIEIDRELDIDRDKEEDKDRKIDINKSLSKIEQAYFITFYRQMSATYIQKVLKILEKGDYAEIIVYALELTKKRIEEQGKAKGFNYTLAIVESWVNQGFNTIADIKKSEVRNKGKTTDFCNYEQRHYDFDSLEKKLLGWDKS